MGVLSRNASVERMAGKPFGLVPSPCGNLKPTSGFLLFI